MIRVFQHGDHEAIAGIFTRAVHEIAPAAYTREQCQAWAGRTPGAEHWRKRCEFKRPFVSTIEGRVAGFLEVDPDGHIDCAYVHPDFQRRGIMTGLVEHAVRTCFEFHVNRIHVEAPSWPVRCSRNAGSGKSANRPWTSEASCSGIS